MKNVLTLVAVLLSSVWTLAFEYDLRAICKNPQANELFVGGEFNTILVIDEQTGNEIRRFATTFDCIDLQFSQDGKTLLAAASDYVYLLNPETGEQTAKVKAAGARLFENAPYFIDADWIFTKAVKVYSSNDGSQQFVYTPEYRPLDAGFNADYTELIVLGKEEEIKGEKKLIQTKIEEADGYNVYNKAYVDQQADDKGAGFTVIDMGSKQVKLDVKIPYATAKSYGLSISKFGDNYYVAAWDIFIKIDKAGNAFPLETNEATFAYAVNSTFDSKHIVVASTRSGYVYDCSSEQFISFDCSDGGGFAYSTDITELNGTTYMLNKDYSICQLNDKGMVKKTIQICNELSGKIAVYYRNGYSKKEDRDKEAAIINNLLTAKGQTAVDLENQSSDYVQIGIFENVRIAQEYVKALDDAGLNYAVSIAPINE